MRHIKKQGDVVSDFRAPTRDKIAICVEDNYTPILISSLMGHGSSALKPMSSVKKAGIARVLFERIEKLDELIGEIIDRRFFTGYKCNPHDRNYSDPVQHIAVAKFRYRYCYHEGSWRFEEARYLRDELPRTEATHIAFFGSLGHSNNGDTDDVHKAMEFVLEKHRIIPVYLTTQEVLSKELFERRIGDHAVKKTLSLIERHDGWVYLLDLEELCSPHDLL